MHITISSRIVINNNKARAEIKETEKLNSLSLRRNLRLDMIEMCGELN
jgi:hypothetical protein